MQRSAQCSCLTLTLSNIQSTHAPPACTRRSQEKAVQKPRSEQMPKRPRQAAKVKGGAKATQRRAPFF
jgi:hypothetical protein